VTTVASLMAGEPESGRQAAHLPAQMQHPDVIASLCIWSAH
jgi:hypothetical protein